MEVHYRANGSERKRLAGVIADVMGEKAEYLGAPTFAFKAGDVMIDRNGTAFITERTARQTSAILAAASAAGFTCDDENLPCGQEEKTCEPVHIKISLPRGPELTDEKLDNLRKTVESRQELLCRAFGCERAEITVTEDTISFPWFTVRGGKDETKIYTQFVTALKDQAVKLKWVNERKNTGDQNDKYTFRCFLMRLGFIGDDYKAARKLLLRNLAGSSAFRNGKGKNK